MSAYPTDNTSSTIPAAVNNTGGTYSESAFLSIVIPEIEASPAFQDNGLIVVTYDEAYPPFTLSSDSQANSQLQNADANGSLENDEAGETLYGRSLNWEPTGPNATIVTSPVGQVLTAGPGDSADIDRPVFGHGRSGRLRRADAQLERRLGAVHGPDSYERRLHPRLPGQR